jgi:hypothetical protein
MFIRRHRDIFDLEISLWCKSNPDGFGKGWAWRGISVPLERFIAEKNTRPVSVGVGVVARFLSPDFVSS